jgi:small subunit ribosomal protein S15
LARIHAHTHGKSHSTRPISYTSPSWINQNSELSTIIVQLSKDGLSPSEIGVRMRDQYGVPLIKPILGKGINKVLQENNSTSEMAEDLNQLVQKALALQKHLKVHNTDKRNIRSLELIEAKIHRLSKYYKKKGKIAQSWKYAAVIARLE